MSTIINATTTNGVVIQPDNSGSLVLQTNSGTTALTIDTSQRAAFVAGTAALPAITTTGDTNTGIWFPASDTIAFAEGGTEAMRIDSSGNVSIGVQTANARLELAKTSGVALRLNDLSTNYWEISNDSNLIFNRGGTERMRIDSSGNLLLNTTTATHSGVASKCILKSSENVLGVVTDSGNYQAVRFTNGTTAVGSINLTASTTSYATSSDYRLKENIVPMTGALDKVSQLKPVTYKWKIDGSNGQGFIAHELAEVIPDCVSGEKDAVDDEGNPSYQGVDTSFLVATLTAAIQEQQTIINDLKARVTALEAK